MGRREFEAEPVGLSLWETATATLFGLAALGALEVLGTEGLEAAGSYCVPAFLAALLISKTTLALETGVTTVHGSGGSAAFARADSAIVFWGNCLFEGGLGLAAGWFALHQL
ncbi:MAG: hypothetical protein R3F62_15100 [Planctomycetota bacterium]